MHATPDSDPELLWALKGAGVLHVPCVMGAQAVTAARHGMAWHGMASPAALDTPPCPPAMPCHAVPCYADLRNAASFHAVPVLRLDAPLAGTVLGVATKLKLQLHDVSSAYCGMMAWRDEPGHATFKCVPEAATISCLLRQGFAARYGTLAQLASAVPCLKSTYTASCVHRNASYRSILSAT